MMDPRTQGLTVQCVTNQLESQPGLRQVAETKGGKGRSKVWVTELEPVPPDLFVPNQDRYAPSDPLRLMSSSNVVLRSALNVPVVTQLVTHDPVNPQPADFVRAGRMKWPGAWLSVDGCRWWRLVAGDRNRNVPGCGSPRAPAAPNPLSKSASPRLSA